MPRKSRKTKGTEKPGGKPVAAPEKPGVQSRAGAAPAAREIAADILPVVGIVASAGGLTAFVKLLDALPEKCGMAFVAIPHLDPKRESLMPEILRRHTKLPVVAASDGERVVADRVYVIPPDRVMTIGGGVLRLAAADARSSPNALDIFLRSLAEDQQEKAIGIVLSGTGSSGTPGIKEIKSAGGMVMVQDPTTAEQDAMPRSAIASGLVDFVLPPEKMPAALISYVKHYFSGFGPHSESAAPVEDTMTKVLALLRARNKLDFRSYRKRMLQRRIQRRMGLAQVGDMDQYLALLRERPEEIKLLSRDLFISVTSFFRDRHMYEILEAQVLPELLRLKPPDSPLRVWVPACATGEEAYSLAMVCIEQIAASGKPCPLQIFASDAESQALDTARQGIYPESVLADVGSARLTRFFTRADANHYQVNKSLREVVLFAQQNLLTDAPFSRIDLVSCRNFLIYLESDVQQKLVSLMHFALNEGGYLVLGPSESVGPLVNLFEPVSKKWRIYRRVGASLRPRAEFPAEFYEKINERARPPLPTRAPGTSAPEQIMREALLAEYAPASVLVGRDYEVLYFYGATNRYLEQPSGQPTRNLTSLTSDSLRSRVRAAAHKAQREGRRVSVGGGRVRRNGHAVSVRVSAKPLGAGRPGAPGESLLLISFEDEAGPVREQKPRAKAAEDSMLQDLEQELKSTREDLQSTIEELETSNEELKASNEEVMSMNEELQSANEEMETSKEELQSLNEELSTVNSQLQEKVLELEATSNDLANLLSSADTATVFLDPRHVIRRFTGPAPKVLRIIESDIGRPISDIAWSFSDPELETDADLVLQTLQPRDKEIVTHDGRWHQRRIVPYRTRDNRIEGVVITFSDVTSLKAAENELRDLNADLEARVKQRTDEVEALASRLTLTEQTERRRLSHFLHDDLQQILYSAELKLDGLAKAQNGEGRVAVVRETHALVREAIEATRKLAVDLSPPVLKNEGLVPMLVWLGARIKEAHGLDVLVKGQHGQYPMSDGIRLLLYQSARELLFNVVKHAGAKLAVVEVGITDGNFRIEVADDGRGFDVNALPTTSNSEGNFGFPSLRERLSLFGGHVGVETTPGHGARVTLLLPEARLKDNS